jgi:hypothetical protein
VVTNWVAWRANGGIAAARNPPTTAAPAANTVITAAYRGTLRRVSADTAGSRPIARNSASPISTSTLRTVMI